MSNYLCITCGSENVQLCMPAWFRPNEEMEFVEMDTEALELSVFCPECEQCEGIVCVPTGRIITGRW